METIIQQIVTELVRRITEKAYAGGIRDIDALASDVLADCKEAATSLVEAICSSINVSIREDKGRRKELGLVLKEKERPRMLLTELGSINLQRDYYYDKKNSQYVSLLDRIVGLTAYERVGDTLKAKMVSLATDMSYAKSADIATGGEVSRQTVKNSIKKIQTLEKAVEDSEKRDVKELHIFADEDHVHLQKPKKEKGKKSKIVPLVTVTEGIDTSCKNRHKTKESMHFVDEEFSTKNLWKSVEGYIDKAYDLPKVEAIYIHGDGGRWIKTGLSDLPQVVHVMDGYHLEKRIKSLSRAFPHQNVSQRIHSAIWRNDRRKADEILRSLYVEAEDEKKKTLEEFGAYLMGNWEEIVNRSKLNIPGSCTEALVSHILSDRFSRDPLGWSEEGLGKLSKLRVYVKNGGQITAKDYKKEESQTYREYAEQVIKDAMAGAEDWSIFDGTPYIFDGSKGVQFEIHEIGKIRNTLWS